MRKPFEDLYGREYFETMWNEWVDAYSDYLKNHDGDIVRDRVHEIKKPTLIIHGQVSGNDQQQSPQTPTYRTYIIYQIFPFPLCAL